MAIIAAPTPYVRSILIPAREARAVPGKVDALREAAIKGLLAIAHDQKIGEPNEVSIREGMPLTDFTGAVVYATERWRSPALVLNTWTNVINVAMPAAKACCFYGFYNRDLNPVTVGLRIQLGAGGTARLMLQLEDLYTEPEFSAYHDLVFFLPTNTVVAQLMATAAVTQDFGFRVLIVEKKDEQVAGGYV